MLTTTAYHPQAGGQSERTNQTAQITLRFAIANHPDAEWPNPLPNIQSILNNSASYSAPTELMYGFRVREGIDALGPETNQTHEEITEDRAQLRQQAVEAIDFANVTAKWRDDQQHVTVHDHGAR